jgi:uncharacterized protein (DUF2249 family)
MSAYTTTVNATEYPPHQKHRVIFETFDGLKPGEEMLLVNDHDPIPLHYQFKLERPDMFTWDYIEQGLTEFKIKIGRVSA